MAVGSGKAWLPSGQARTVALIRRGSKCPVIVVFGPRLLLRKTVRSERRLSKLAAAQGQRKRLIIYP